MRNVYGGPHSIPHDDMSGGFCNHCSMKIKQILYAIYTYFSYTDAILLTVSGRDGTSTLYPYIALTYMMWASFFNPKPDRCTTDHR
jgi:hypothetical protein